MKIYQWQSGMATATLFLKNHIKYYKYMFIMFTSIINFRMWYKCKNVGSLIIQYLSDMNTKYIYIYINIECKNRKRTIKSKMPNFEDVFLRIYCTHFYKCVNIYTSNKLSTYRMSQTFWHTALACRQLERLNWLWVKKSITLQFS